MSTPQTSPERDWERLATMPELKRIDVMIETYGELARVSDDERLQRLFMMVLAENDLPDNQLSEMVKDRLRAWTRMDQRAAHTVASDYYPVLHETGEDVERRFKAVEEQVFDILPWEQKRLALNFIPNDEGYIPDPMGSIEPRNEAEAPGGNVARQKEIREQAETRWERFQAWVMAQRPAA